MRYTRKEKLQQKLVEMSHNKFDELLTDLKTGKWNLLYYIASSAWLFLIPAQNLSGAYIAPNIGFLCRPPENLNVTVSKDSCSYEVSASGQVVEYPCTKWDYDTSVFSSTLTSEFDLVCDREYLRATYQSIKMAGAFFSPIVGGYLADRFGRKIVVVVTLVIFALCTTSMCFLRDLQVILAFRFIVGFVDMPVFYSLTLEICEVRFRSLVGVLTALPWAFGTMAWGGIAYFIREWRTLQLVASFPNLLILPALYFIDESPRWLITKGQHDKAVRVLRKAARWNNSELPPEAELRTLMQDIEEEAKKKRESAKCGASSAQTASASTVRKKLFGILSRPLLCSTRRISLITVIMCVDYFVAATVFYGLSLNSTNFSADPFIYMILSGLMEIPAYSVTAPVIQKFGRKKTTIFGFAVTGVAILALAFISEDIVWLVMTFALLGKMLISMAFQTIYVYVNELFPTVVRGEGLGVAFIASKIGSVIAPYITEYLGPLVPWIPSIIFGGCALVAAFSTLLLPETKGKPLPDTIWDLEEKRTRKERADLEEGGEELSQLSS
ncbi:organic cation transporter protein-like [Macrobrachium rosenbergii]|uniref:organic cation transporter protein-like n=1 Tax=Macrobrachium rosenbergii TaxID=79674 RepID=UPI0034D402CE